jgi:hypothetical protein
VSVYKIFTNTYGVPHHPPILGPGGKSPQGAIAHGPQMGGCCTPCWGPGTKDHAAADAIPNYVNTEPLTRVRVLNLSTKIQTVDLRRREGMVPP